MNKTLWEMADILVTSIFSYFHNVFFFPIQRIYFHHQSINYLTFSKQQNFTPNQIESICRGQNKCVSKQEFCFGRIENIVGKLENAGYQHFLLFPTMFSLKLLSQCRQKSGLCCEWTVLELCQVVKD